MSNVMKYQQNPIEGLQFNGNTPQMEVFIGDKVMAILRITDDNSIVTGIRIATPGKELIINKGDFVIRELTGEFSVFSSIDFKKMYLPLLNQ